MGDPVDFWPIPATIERNHFVHKSLSCWAFNVSVGCTHACRFCYVPDASTVKQSPRLRQYGIEDPAAEWGDYSLLRPWNETKFLGSLHKAEQTPLSSLNPDGNRAIILCSTTDPFQTFVTKDRAKQVSLNAQARALVRSALELIRDRSSLNVRILTRSPLAAEFFDLFKTFGKRLVFGMSLPTLNNNLAKVYEPKAPAPTQRLKTLHAAKSAGLHVFVAMAPTYPECGEADLRLTLKAIKEIDPITIYHEPINIRADNIQRIKDHASFLSITLNTGVFATPSRWRRYALDALVTVQRLAQELGLIDRLHLWPDSSLISEAHFLEMRKQERLSQFSGREFTTYEKARLKDQDLIAAVQNEKWIRKWWSRVSEWPR